LAGIIVEKSICLKLRGDCCRREEEEVLAVLLRSSLSLSLSLFLCTFPAVTSSVEELHIKKLFNPLQRRSNKTAAAKCVASTADDDETE
jgi:hypothetical protein